MNDVIMVGFVLLAVAGVSLLPHAVLLQLDMQAPAYATFTCSTNAPGMPLSARTSRASYAAQPKPACRQCNTPNMALATPQSARRSDRVSADQVSDLLFAVRLVQVDWFDGASALFCVSLYTSVLAFQLWSAGEGVGAVLRALTGVELYWRYAVATAQT